MKGVKAPALMVFLGAALLAGSSGGPIALIKISKVPGPVELRLETLRIDVRQELETCFLALAEPEDLDRLRKNKVGFSVIDRTAGGGEVLLVRVDDPDALSSLRRAGRASVVEPGTAVFWTETGSASASVPAGLPRKALSLRSVLPYLSRRSATATSKPVTAAPDPLIQTIVSLVSGPGLSSRVQTLQDFQTRYASTANCESAGGFLFSEFSALGLDDVRFQAFPFSSYTSRNVIAEKTGETYPDDVFIICGHYDSTSPAATRQTSAPGADDDASGTAAVLEAAYVLAAFQLDFTVRFIAFSAEEWGLYGSRAYAAAARQAGERVLGVINLDMIGYADAPPEDLQIIVNSRSSWLADLFIAAAANYGPVGATKTVDASFVYSDHSPFWDNAYPALLAIEDNPLRNPYYHQTSDTLDRFDIGFFTGATRSSVGLLAELAQPIRAGYPRTPVGLQSRWVVYTSLFNSLSAVRLTWTGQSDAAGYNVYRADVSHVGYVKINAAPVAGTSFNDNAVTSDLAYYYVVTAVAASGLESNRSRETSPYAIGIDTVLRSLAPTLIRFRRGI